MAQYHDSDKRPDGAVAPPAPANEHVMKIAASFSPVQTTDREKEKVYSCFTSGEKWGIISLISLASIFSLVPSNL